MKKMGYICVVAVASVIVCSRPVLAEWRIPKSASCQLIALFEGKQRVPAIYLSAAAGGGSDKVGPLKVRTRYSAKELRLTVSGYSFTKIRGGIQPMVMKGTSGTVKVDLKWLGEDTPKSVNILLQGRTNRFRILRKGYRVHLEQLETSNVNCASKFGSRKERAWLKGSKIREVILYPPDVARLYVAGGYSYKVDYSSAMVDVAVRQGCRRLGEVYEGLPDSCRRNHACVVAPRNLIPKPNHGKELGALPGSKSGTVYIAALSRSITSHALVNGKAIGQLDAMIVQKNERKIYGLLSDFKKFMKKNAELDSESGISKACEVLEMRLKNGEPNIRKWTVALAAVLGNRALPILKKTLASDSGAARKNAEAALLAIGSPEARKLLSKK